MRCPTLSELPPAPPDKTGWPWTEESPPLSEIVPDELKDIALELDKAYIPTHYPNAHPSGSPRRRYTRAEAERMVAYAEGIIRFCEGFLSAL